MKIKSGLISHQTGPVCFLVWFLNFNGNESIALLMHINLIHKKFGAAFLTGLLMVVSLNLPAMENPAFVAFTEAASLVQEKDSAEPYLVETQSTVRFFKDMDNFSSVMAYIPAGEVVEVFEEIDEYYSAGYQGGKGYVMKSKVKPLNFSLRQQGSEVPAQKKDRWTYLVNKYDSKTAQALFEHKIWKGMSTQMALDSWGYPKRMERYMGSDPRYEEWKYTNYLLIFSRSQLIQWKKK